MKWNVTWMMLVLVGLAISLSAFRGKSTESSEKSGNVSDRTYEHRQAERPLGPYIEFSAKPYRPIDVRPRDGKPCGCKACFGICDLKVTTGVKSDNWFGFAMITTGPSTGIVYFLDKPINSELEFGIDAPIQLPPSLAEGLGYSSITLKKGLYEYDSRTVEVDTGGGVITSFGSVQVNLLTR